MKKIKGNCRSAEQTACSGGSRCQAALLPGLIEPLSNHLQVRIPPHRGEGGSPASGLINADSPLSQGLSGQSL